MADERSAVRITYLDPVETSGEHTLKEVEETEPLECTVYGEVLKENDRFITVLAYREKPQSKVKLEHYAITILKCAIVERKLLIPKP